MPNDNKRLPLALTPENVTATPPVRDDISFTHSVFAQCFLPLRKLRDGAISYEARHGRASLAIDAGRLLNPKTGDLVKQDVPYGPAARVILAHVHNHAIRAGSLDAAQVVPMGDSLRDFFRDYRLKVSGQNGRQIRQQVNNIAAARITIGLWNENSARQINVPTLAEKIHFWLEKDGRQRTLWQPNMILNRRYVEAIREHSVPLDMRGLIGLYSKPRAMDVFTWLSYRLPLIKKARGIFLPYEGESGLHSMFGRGIKDKTVFRQEFQKTLRDVANWYPEARITIERDGIRLFSVLPLYRPRIPAAQSQAYSSGISSGISRRKV